MLCVADNVLYITVKYESSHFTNTWKEYMFIGNNTQEDYQEISESNYLSVNTNKTKQTY